MTLRLGKLSQHLAFSSTRLLSTTAGPRLSYTSVRTMASAPRKYEFLVVVPDFPGVREKRLAVRP